MIAGSGKMSFIRMDMDRSDTSGAPAPRIVCRGFWRTVKSQMGSMCSMTVPTVITAPASTPHISGLAPMHRTHKTLCQKDGGLSEAGGSRKPIARMGMNLSPRMSTTPGMDDIEAVASVAISVLVKVPSKEDRLEAGG